MRVPMRNTGADCLVVAMKDGNAFLSEGGGLSSPIQGSTMNDGRNSLKKAKPFEISQKVVGRRGNR